MGAQKPFASARSQTSSSSTSGKHVRNAASLAALRTCSSEAPFKLLLEQESVRGSGSGCLISRYPQRV